MRYENPLYFAEEAATTDLISDGRLQLGVSRGSPEAAVDGQEQFGYSLAPGQTWSDVAQQRGQRIRDSAFVMRWAGPRLPPATPSHRGLPVGQVNSSRNPSRPDY